MYKLDNTHETLEQVRYYRNLIFNFFRPYLLLEGRGSQVLEGRILGSSKQGLYQWQKMSLIIDILTNIPSHRQTSFNKNALYES